MTQEVPVKWNNMPEWMRKFAIAINEIINGRVNSTGTVTLTANQATTVVVDRRIGRDSVILLMPLTANASAEIGAGTVYVGESDISPTSNPPQFTVNHANNAQTDRDFRYTILGSELS